MENHKDFISSLCKDADPVKPTMCWNRRAIAFIFIAYTLVAIGVSGLGFRHDIATIMENKAVFYQLVALFLSGFIAALATFRLSIPRDTIDLTTKIQLGISTLIIIGLSSYCMIMGDSADLDRYLNFDEIMYRVKNLAMLSVFPIIIMVYLVKRARPVHTSMAGFACFLSVSSIAVMGCRMTCPIDSLYGNLLWHYLPILVLAGLGYLIGRFLYR